jgi:hypothetical protein
MQWAALGLSVAMLASHVQNLNAAEAGEAGVQVTVEPLTGTPASGELIAITDASIKVKGPEAVVELPLAQVLSIRNTAAPTTPRSPDVEKSLTQSDLRDGGRLGLSGLTLTDGRLRGMHHVLGDIELSQPELRSLRFAASDSKVDAAWKELSSRKSNRDMVVLRKGDVLDHLEGTVSGVGEKSIQFLLDGEEVPVKRERVFGIVFAAREATAPSLIRCDLGHGEMFLVDQIRFQDGGWELRRGGSIVQTPAGIGPVSIDYSAGKLLFLSEVEPRSTEYVPFFGYTWEYRKDRSFEGRPLAVGTRTYRRGLAIHSKSEITWRLGGEYRRFQSVIGYDPEISTASTALVKVIGDGKDLLKLDLARGTPPHAVDLDMTDIIELTIVVDFGTDEVDIGDRIHFGDAKVLK